MLDELPGQLAFARERPGHGWDELVVVSGQPGRTLLRVAAIAIQGGPLRLVTSEGEDASAPVWSADGLPIYFVRDQRAIVEIARDGTGARTSRSCPPRSRGGGLYGVATWR